MRRGLNFNLGSKRARQARDALPTAPAEPLPCVVSALEAIGVDVVVARLRDGVDGACIHGGDFAIAYVTDRMPATRQRFTLAHELGHVRLGHDGGGRVDSYATMHGHLTNAHEVQANHFASEFLMPRAGVCELVPEGTAVTLEHLVRLAAGFGVSPEAMLYRAGTCDRLTDERFDRLKAELLAGDHVELRDALGDLVRPTDKLEGLATTYLSPSLHGTALGDLLRGHCTVAEAAGVSGADVEDLQQALDVLEPSGVPAA